MARKVEEIQSEYVELAKQAGDMGYRIKCFEADLERVHAQMLKLNQEAVEAAKESENEQKSSDSASA